MKNIDRLKRPYHILFLAAIVLMVLSVFSRDNELDIHAHDTYFVTTFSHLFLGAAYLLLAFWLVYTALWKLLSNRDLTWIHIITTVLSLVLVLLSLWQSAGATTAPAGRGFIMLSSYEEVPKQLAIGILIFAVAQLCLIANLLWGIGRAVSSIINRGKR